MQDTVSKEQSLSLAATSLLTGFSIESLHDDQIGKGIGIVARDFEKVLNTLPNVDIDLMAELNVFLLLDLRKNRKELEPEVKFEEALTHYFAAVKHISDGLKDYGPKIKMQAVEDFSGVFENADALGSERFEELILGHFKEADRAKETAHAPA